MEYSLMIVKYGELALKGINRYYFENLLVQNIRNLVTPYKHTRVTKEHGRIFIQFDPSNYEDILESIKNVFGIVAFCPAYRVKCDLDLINESALKQVKELLKENKHLKSFKVVARRSNKAFPLESPEIAKQVGGFIFENIEDLEVDVHQPEFKVNIEIRSEAYIYTQDIPGMGGMPYKSAGSGVVLLSGGIDSPVAAWMMGKRGVEIEALHFHSYPFTSERAKDKVVDLSKKLCAYIGKIKLNSVNILEIQKAINEKCPEEQMTILSRCFMMMIADRFAKMNDHKCLITGESIGQVASQTMEGLNVTNSMTDLPVFRPLIAMDKSDIVKVARTIDTFETSILPFEDCCTVFLPSRVVTKPKLEKIRESLSKLDVEQLIENALQGIETEEIWRV